MCIVLVSSSINKYQSCSYVMKDSEITPNCRYNVHVKITITTYKMNIIRHIMHKRQSIKSPSIPSTQPQFTVKLHSQFFAILTHKPYSFFFTNLMSKATGQLLEHKKLSQKQAIQVNSISSFHLTILFIFNQNSTFCKEIPSFGIFQNLYLTVNPHPFIMIMRNIIVSTSQ